MPHPLAAGTALALALAGPVHALDLTVDVENAQPEQGPVAAALYDGAGWLRQPLQTDRQPAPQGRAVLTFRDVAPGSYALAVFQDDNGNGRLDRNLVGLPLERYGFSRDASGAMGPPAFEDAALEVRDDTTTFIRLR